MNDIEQFLIRGPEVAAELFCHREILRVVRGWAVSGRRWVSGRLGAEPPAKAVSRTSRSAVFAVA